MHIILAMHGIMEIEAWMRQLRKGAAEFAVLALLEAKPLYGTLVLSRLSSYEGLGISESSIYPLLNRLERSGRLVSDWRMDPGASHPRKYYSLSETGAKALMGMRPIWSNFRNAIDDITTLPERAA